MAQMPTGDGVMYLGIDGGGSKTKAILINAAGDLLGTGVAGPANPLHGVEQTFTSIKLAAELALDEANLPVSAMARLIVGAGLAGVNLPELYAIVEQWEHPFAQFHLTTDLHIACLGAHEGRDGAVVIAGTGSCGYVAVKGRTKTVGGHGFPFGDSGSGAWLGLEALKYALKASDGLAPASPLAAQVEEFLEARGIGMVSRMVGATSRDYARLAPLVLEQARAGDAVSLAMVREGADYLSSLARKLLEEGDVRLSMIGGLAEPLQQWMDADLVKRIKPVMLQPEWGAILFARQQLEQLEKTA